MPRKVLIQIRRGLEGSIGTLAVGELGYCTDTKKLYIGTDSGNELLVAAQTVGDMLKSIYDTDNDGKVDAAETAESVSWAGVSGKPSTFAPSTHTHDDRYYTESESNSRFAGIGNVENTGGQYFNRRMGYLDNVSPQYWILCANAPNNDINGNIRMDRTSAYCQAAHLDVIVTSGTDDMKGGSLTSHQVLHSNESYKLVTITYEGTSYVAIKYAGSPYPASSGIIFTGRVASTAGVLTFTAIDSTEVSNEEELGGDTKFNFDVNSVRVKENEVWHKGNFNPSLKANISSPAFTGTPTAPTASASTNNTQIATTAFVKSAWSTVSQTEAEAGTATSQRLWTAQRVAQAIAAQAMPKGPVTWNQLKGV